jgi:hypothetical protein
VLQEYRCGLGGFARGGFGIAQIGDDNFKLRGVVRGPGFPAAFAFVSLEQGPQLAIATFSRLR